MSAMMRPAAARRPAARPHGRRLRARWAGHGRRRSPRISGAPCDGSSGTAPGAALDLGRHGAAIIGVIFRSSAPRVLANATNALFAGVIGKHTAAPAGTQAQVETAARHGQGQIADMLSGMHVSPGEGVDFGASARILLRGRVSTSLGAFFSGARYYIMAGVSQRTVYRLRREVEEKLAPPAPALLRQPPARRHPEPGHQRHRQHRHHAAAEPDADPHLGVHRHRRARHDVLRSARCWR